MKKQLFCSSFFFLSSYVYQVNKTSEKGYQMFLLQHALISQRTGHISMARKKSLQKCLVTLRDCLVALAFLIKTFKKKYLWWLKDSYINSYLIQNKLRGCRSNTAELHSAQIRWVYWLQSCFPNMGVSAGWDKICWAP